MVEFLCADHDRLTMAFFAAHKPFSIPLDLIDTQKGVIPVLMANVDDHPQAEAFQRMWERLPEEVSFPGAGENNLSVIGWP